MGAKLLLQKVSVGIVIFFIAISCARCPGSRVRELCRVSQCFMVIRVSHPRSNGLGGRVGALLQRSRSYTTSTNRMLEITILLEQWARDRRKVSSWGWRRRLPIVYDNHSYTSVGKRSSHLSFSVYQGLGKNLFSFSERKLLANGDRVISLKEESTKRSLD